MVSLSSISTPRQHINVWFVKLLTENVVRL